MDCEFGGLDSEKHDITEVAIILTDERLVEISEQSWKVSCRADRITPEAAAIFGYDEEEWKDAPHVRQVLTELSAMLPKGKTVLPAGQNIRMDVQFLERAFKACEIPYPFDYHVLDLATLYYCWCLTSGISPTAVSLRQAATTAGLLEGKIPHRAAGDARLTLETFRYFLGRLSPRPAPESIMETLIAKPENS